MTMIGDTDADTHADTETHRKTDTPTDTDMHTHLNRHTHTQTGKEPGQQTSRPAFFNFGPLVVCWSLSVGLLVPVSCLISTTVVQGSQGSRPADQL